MAVDTFGGIWRATRLHCPLAPPMLVRQWVNQAYRDIVDQHAWSWLRSENEFIVNPAKTGTVTVTTNSAVILDNGGTLFAASDAGRQIRISQPQVSPVYTLISVVPGVSATIDRPYGPPSSSAGSATVLDAYLTCPADFGRFFGILDQVNNWQLHWWITEEELNTWDSQRSAQGTAWAVVTRRLSSYAATTGQVQFELWPYQTAQKNYPFYYMRRAETLTSDSQTFQGPLAQRADVLIDGALAYCCEWPGADTAEKRNPYYNLGAAKMKRDRFDKEVARLEVIDEDIYPTWFETVSWINRLPFAPIDAKFIQGHDVPWGAGGWGYGSDGLSPWVH